MDVISEEVEKNAVLWSMALVTVREMLFRHHILTKEYYQFCLYVQEILIMSNISFTASG